MRDQRRFKIGVQLEPQHTSMEELRQAWRAADQLGLDSLWTWDHFRPVRGDRSGTHFEGWTQLAAMAVETAQTPIGVLVSCIGYRNPDLLADMARTIDHLSDGRAMLGLGAGWYGDEYADYGFDFGTVGSRLTDLEDAVPRVRRRLELLNPGPKGPLPLMIGGGGARRTLKLVATHADAWNLVTNDPAELEEKNDRLTAWCEELGRDPAEVERTVLLNDPRVIHRAQEFVDAGAQHVIVAVGHPFDFDAVEAILATAR